MNQSMIGMATKFNNSNVVPNIICGCGRAFTKRGIKIHKCDLKPEVFECPFCEKEFTAEKYLFTHECEQKRRHNQIKEKVNIQAFKAYEWWYKQTYGKTKTYDDFCKSSFYNGFIKFSKFALDNEIYNPLLYIEHLIRISAKLDDWTNEKLYTTYIRELNKNETPLVALERSIKVMQQWSIRYGDGGDNWFEFFHKVETPLAALWISTGRISPWLIFLAPQSSVRVLLQRFSKEQSAMFKKAIDTEFWKAKIERADADEIEHFRTVLQEMEIDNDNNK